MELDDLFKPSFEIKNDYSQLLESTALSYEDTPLSKLAEEIKNHQDEIDAKNKRLNIFMAISSAIAAIAAVASVVVTLCD